MHTHKYNYRALQIVQGGKLLWYAELNCNSLENFRGRTLVVYSQSLIQVISLEKLANADRSAKNAKLSHHE